MAVNVQKVKIKDSKDNILLLPTDAVGRLSKSLLQKFLSGAKGLVKCTLHGKEVLLEEDGVILPPDGGWGNIIYEAHTDSEFTENKDRITELIAKIREERKYTGKLRKAQTNSTKKISVPKMWKLHIGWLHKSKTSPIYSQVRSQCGGGIRYITMKAEDDFKVCDVIELGKQIFFDDDMTPFGPLEDLEFKLGNFKKEVLDVFTDEVRNECGVRGYMSSRGFMPSRQNFYLMTNTQSVTPLSNENTSLFISDSEVDKCDISVNVHSTETDETNFTISYRIVRISKYNGAISYIDFDTKESCYEHALENNASIPLEEFNPLESGFEIASIQKGAVVLLDIEYDTATNKKKYSFKSLNMPPHTLIHDVTDNVGMCESELGMCCISTCEENCLPIFRWYVDGSVLCEGKYIYWTKIEKAGTYMCEIRCANGVQVSSSVNVNISEMPINEGRSVSNTNPIIPQDSGVNLSCSLLRMPTAKHLTDSELDKTSIVSDSNNSASSNSNLPLILERDLIISKVKLGSGFSGTVRKGMWFGTDVAVKTIQGKPGSYLHSLLLREIAVHTIVRHSHIVQIMGICSVETKTHLVMELVKGHNLDEILFDESVCSDYPLNENDRQTIAKNICQAVTYLHNLSPSIIHQDIKPANILVSRSADGYSAKVCDLGLSKISSRKNINFTMGGKKGTFMFMAPEMILYDVPGNEMTDIWSVGCTLIELFTNDHCWDINEAGTPESIIKKNLENKMPPSGIRNLPECLVTVIHLCCNYEPHMRPAIKDVLMLINTSLKKQ